jgi:antitoxin CptB
MRDGEWVMGGSDSRLVYQCRRGMLELDLVLGRFLEKHFAALDAEQKRAFSELLELADNDLWDLILGRTQSDNARFLGLLASLRATGL